MDSGGPEEACVRCGADPHAKGNFSMKEHALACLTTLQKWLDRSRCCLGCGLWFAKGSMCYMGAYWRNLANTMEVSVCCGDVALRQITFTTCYNLFCSMCSCLFGDVDGGFVIADLYRTPDIFEHILVVP